MNKADREAPGSSRAAFSFDVAPEENRRRLDAVLAARYPQVPRSRWQERIHSGTVRIGNEACRPSRRVRTNEVVSFEFIRRPEPEVNRNYEIIWQDQDLLVINKPPDLPVHPSGVYQKNTLHGLLLERFGDDFVAHFAHRLDRETSGLIVLGMNRTAARKLSESFRSKQTVRKDYLALVEGNFAERIDAQGYMLRDNRSIVRKKMRFIPADDFQEPTHGPAKTARTLLRSVALTGQGVSLVHARLFSGRLHQIRATLLALGFPMVGDRLYGVDDELYVRFIEDLENAEDRRRLRLTRTALHCRRLHLPHPATGAPMRFVAPLPPDMRGLLGSQSTRRP